MVLKAHIGIRLFFYTLSILFTSLFILGIFDIITRWNSYEAKDKILVPLGIIVLLWLAIQLVQIINGYYIVLTDSEITIKTWENDFSNIDVKSGDILGQIKIPKTKTFTIDANDILAIKTGSLKNLMKFCNDDGDTAFALKISNFQDKLKRKSNLFTAFTINSRTYMYLKLRNNTPKIVDIEFISRKKIDMFICQVKAINKDIAFN